MNYQTKRLIGTIFMTVLALFVWALITGTAHAQTPAAPFTNAQLLSALPTAQRNCLQQVPNGPDCNAVTNIAAELLNRGVTRAPDVSTANKLRVLVILNEQCLRLRVCAFDAVIMQQTFAQQLIVSRIKPDDYLRTVYANYAELHELAPVFAMVLDAETLKVQGAR